MMRAIAGVLLIAACAAASDQVQFRVIKEWRYVNYTWRTEEDLRAATASGMYHPSKLVMSGLGYYDGYYYLTTPRMYDTPATLSRIPEGGNTSPLLAPFPSWEKNRIGDCSALQNVQNMEIDSDGNMYVIDSGRTNTVGHHSNNLCPAKIVKFDLKTPAGDDMAKEIYRYEFPDSVASRQVNFLYDLVIEDHFVYISDNSGVDPGLVVFSELEMKSWKIRHGTFKGDQNATRINVTGVVLDAMLNLAGLALGPQTKDGRLLFYAPLSSYQLFGVNTNELKNPTATTLTNVRRVGIMTSQSDGMIVDDEGVLYFGQLGTSSVARWDTKMASFRAQVIARDPQYVQWPNSFAFNEAGHLVVLCNTLARFIRNRVDLDAFNFRLLAGNVSAQSYLRNRYKYDMTVEHVHLQPVTPNATIRSPMGDAADVNDLLIVHDHIDHASGAIPWTVSNLLVILACALMLHLRN